MDYIFFMSDFELVNFNTTTLIVVKDVFGWTAGILCFGILIPQIVHIWKTKSATDLSIWFLALNEICCVCYIIYGLIIGSYPIVICDAGILVVNTILIISKNILDKKQTIAQKEPLQIENKPEI